MNKTTGSRQQRSKRTKRLIVATAMATLVGGFGVAITLPANASSGSQCATPTCTGGSKPLRGISHMGIEDYTEHGARGRLEQKCAELPESKLTITDEYSGYNGDEWVFAAVGDCEYRL